MVTATCLVLYFTALIAVILRDPCGLARKHKEK